MLQAPESDSTEISIEKTRTNNNDIKNKLIQENCNLRLQITNLNLELQKEITSHQITKFNLHQLEYANQGEINHCLNKLKQIDEAWSHKEIDKKKAHINHLKFLLQQEEQKN